MNNTEFKVNKYLLLRLEGNYTTIFVNGKRFDYCKRLFIIIPKTDIENYDRIESIDEATDLYDHYLIDNETYKEEHRILYPSSYSYNISPETEFWGHCSNIQAWVENDYDTRILHSNLAFPLLKELTTAGDPIAKGVFKEEIAKRISSGYYPTIKYLILEGYIFFLAIEELLCALDICREKIDYPHYTKLICKIMKEWNKIIYYSEEINNRIIKRERKINFFLGQLLDTKLNKYFEYFTDEYYERLSENLRNIFCDYRSDCWELCWDYSKAGMYDKLEKHCTFLLNQDSKSSYIWKYLGIAYRNKGLTIYAKVADNIYQMKEKLKEERRKKIRRKNRIKQFFWAYFCCYFTRDYWYSRKRYKRSFRNEL